MKIFECWDMMLSAVSLALVVVVVVMASSEDCPHHCPPVESPVCGTGEQPYQSARQLTDLIFR